WPATAGTRLATRARTPGRRHPGRAPAALTPGSSAASPPGTRRCRTVTNRLRFRAAAIPGNGIGCATQHKWLITPGGGEIMASDPLSPTPEHRFSFGLWTVGHPGRDPFGEVVRAPVPPAEIVRQLAALGAWGV